MIKRSEITINKNIYPIKTLPIASQGSIVEVKEIYKGKEYSTMIMIITTTEEYFYLTEIGGHGDTLKVKPEKACGLIIGNHINVVNESREGFEYRVTGICDVDIDIKDIRHM